MAHLIFLFSINFSRTRSPSAEVRFLLRCQSLEKDPGGAFRYSPLLFLFQLNRTHSVLLVVEAGTFLNSGQACSQHYREGEIWIACRVRRTVFHANSAFLSWFVSRISNKIRSIHDGPGGENWGFVTGNQAFVRIHPLVRNQYNLTSVPKQSSDIVSGKLREILLVFGIVKGIPFTLEQRHVSMHPIPILAI